MSIQIKPNFILERIDFQQRIVDSGHWQCCINCDSFDRQTEICETHKAKPPIYIAMHGCERYIDVIPF